jgi:hypothetical protein
MATYYLCPIATILQYFTDAGVVLAGGKISTFLAGTSTPQGTKTDSTGGVDNANPIILNSAGRLQNVSIWQLAGTKLKITLTDAANNPIGPPFDQIAGIDDPSDLLTVLNSATTGSGADLIANAMRSYDLISSLRAANTPALSAGGTLVVDVQAATTPGDGLGGLFYWDASSVLTDNGITIIKPTAVSGAGRYLKQKNTTFYVSKGTLTSRASTTTLTVDPDLQIPLLTNLGTWAFEALLLFNATTGGAGGIAISLKTTSASLVNNPQNIAVGNILAAIATGKATWQPGAISAQITAATITVSGSGNDALYLSGTISGPTTGTFAIAWAQNSSSVNACNMLAGSWMRLTLAQ